MLSIGTSECVIRRAPDAPRFSNALKVVGWALGAATLSGDGAQGGLAAGAGEECRHDVGGVPVERAAGSVITHRRPRIRMRRSFLHIT